MPGFPTSIPDSGRRSLLKAGSLLLLGSQLPLISACRKVPQVATVAPAMDFARLSFANGGTALIGDVARFPNPFAVSNAATACQLTCEMTIGPCHASSAERTDISDGHLGLPVRMLLRVVDEACAPVRDALVEIWHTNASGGYSSKVQPMCTKDAADTETQFFRGYQRTDTNGEVAFNTCYPGWYRGRAVHVHLRVMRGDYAADDRAGASVVTQLLFPDTLNHEIFSRHPRYSALGEPDTTLDSDGVVGGEADKALYLFDVQAMDDGVLLISKTLVVREGNNGSTCQAKGNMPAGGPPPGGPGGSGGPGGAGGPPPGAPPGPPPEGSGPPPEITRAARP